MKILDKLISKYYSKKLREINRVSPDEMYGLFKFSKPEDVIKLLKCVQTEEIIRYFETDDKESKGAAKICKILLDANRMVVEIDNSGKEDKERESLWRAFYKKFRIN